MPRYKVLEPGFYDGRLYHPRGKRPILHADKPIKPVPSWLEPIKGETPTQRKKRTAAQKKAEADAKAAADQKKVETDSVNFIEPTGSKVETL